MSVDEKPWKIYAPYNTLVSLRELMNEVCRQIVEYRNSVPIVPELCLPTAAKEVSLTPLIMQAAYCLCRRGKPVFLPVAEITVTRAEKGVKGRIDIGLFSERHVTFIEFKAIRSGVKNNNDKAITALEQASAQLKDIDLKALLYSSTTETLKNIRPNNKLIPLVAVNVTCHKDQIEKNQAFNEKVESIRQTFPIAMVVAVRYEPHLIRVKGDKELDSEDRNRVSIGHVFILKEVY